MPQYFLELSCVSVLIRPFLTLLDTLVPGTCSFLGHARSWDTASSGFYYAERLISGVIERREAGSNMLQGKGWYTEKEKKR
jgi:hypothetical protein